MTTTNSSTQISIEASRDADRPARRRRDRPLAPNRTPAELLGARRERRLIQKRHVAPAHHVQVDRVERRHHEDAAQQPVDVELGVQECRSSRRRPCPPAAPATVASAASCTPRPCSAAATDAPSVTEPSAVISGMLKIRKLTYTPNASSDEDQARS